jgi:hypothetical protein
MQKPKRKKHFSWWKKAAKETKEAVAEEVSPSNVISAVNLAEQIGAGIEHVHPPVDIADSLLPDGVDDMAFSLVSAIQGVRASRDQGILSFAAEAEARSRPGCAGIAGKARTPTPLNENCVATMNASTSHTFSA